MKMLISLIASLFVFMLLSILFAYFGLDKIFFIVISLLGTIGVIYGISVFTWGVARRKGLERFWYILFSIALFFAIFVNLFLIFDILYLDLPLIYSISVSLAPFILVVIIFICYKIFAEDEIQRGILMFLLTLLGGNSMGMQFDKTVASNLAHNPRIAKYAEYVVTKTPIFSGKIKTLKHKYPKLLEKTVNNSAHCFIKTSC